MASDIAIDVACGVEPERSLMGLGWRYDLCQSRGVRLTGERDVSGCHASLIVIITLVTPYPHV